MSSIEPEVRKRHSSLKAVILLVLAVGAGFVAGVFGDRIVLLRQRRLLPRQGLEIVSTRIARELDRKLDLSDAQEAEIHEIIETHRKVIETLWSDLRPRVRHEVHAGEDEIRALLDARQQKEYDELIAKWRRRAKLFTGRDPGEE